MRPDQPTSTPAARAVAGLALAAGLGLAGCQTTADAPAPAAPEPVSLETVVLDWQMTPHGPCVATPPPVAYKPTPACAPAASLPGYVFLGVPYIGTAISLGTSLSVSEASACQGEAASAIIYNRQVAKLLAQQCMVARDISAMQTSLGRLGLYRGGNTGVIDPATFEAMRVWHATYDRGRTDFGPTKEFAARVIESTGQTGGRVGAAQAPVPGLAPGTGSLRR